MQLIRLSLDWTPNANHTGFYLARDLGYYREAGLEVEVSDPSTDQYLRTPFKKLEAGEADLAICPTESLVSFRVKERPFAAKAIAALLQEDLSAVVALKGKGIQRPRDMDGRIYASYKARYEDGIVSAMAKMDGGKGQPILTYPEKLGIWNTLLTGEADLTWIFTNWEGVEAEDRGMELEVFRLADFGIPYSYSPVLVASEEWIAHRPTLLQQFLRATAKGFAAAQDDPQRAVVALKAAIGELHLPPVDLLKAQKATNPAYGASEQWGLMDEGKVQAFLDWLHEKGLEPRAFRAHEIVTNELLESVEQ